MKHLELEHFQKLLNPQFKGSERMELVDHILECDTCAQQYKALKALDEQLNQITQGTKPKKHLTRYALGVAAVMAMALSPYLFRNQTTTPEIQIALEHALRETSNLPKLALNDEILRVNFRTALDDWSQQQNLLDLVALKNKTR